MKSIRILYTIIALALFSCANEIETFETNNPEELVAKSSSQSPSYMGVTAMYIDNGTPQECDFNILVFEDDIHYTSVLEALEEQIEVHEDSFVNQYLSLNNDDLNDIEDQIGHNEFQPLLDFESALYFCSLRKVVHQLEVSWLASQPESDIDFTNDPDDLYYFAEDDVERTVLNAFGEVIVGRNLYKLTNDGFYVIDLNNPNLSNILEAINVNNSTPDEIIRTDVSVVYESNVVNVPNPQCQSDLKQSKKIFISNRRIKMKYRLYTGPFNRTAMAKTVGYKKRNGKWKKRRMRISAGFRGVISSPNQFCNEEVNFDKQRSVEKRKRRKYAKRLNRNNYPNKWKISYHELGSWHYVEGNEHIEPIPYN